MLKTISNITRVRLNYILAKNFSKIFTKQHEWIELSGDNKNIAKIGISDFAQSELGTLVHIDLPEKDSNLSQGDSIVINLINLINFRQL